jgi:topoisomerase IV subunit A
MAEKYVDKIIDYSLEEIMGERFGKYSKYIIQDRALPDVRDGLKPVQRRILYAMFVDNNTNQKPHRKSAKTVGYVIANYHPHGDSSVYDAMVRMSQYWKQRVPLVDMHGNNGSIDDDPAAAMRYTESRLTKISDELLKDIDKNTVNFALNFDDTTEEPTVLPSRFPNLLVNGAKGIASGYATFIPPHNLNEVIDGIIYRIKHPKSSIEDLMEIILGPDLPTGGIVRNLAGIKEAFMTGSGQFQVVSKTEIVKEKNTTNLVITEIPFDVVKSDLVAKIDRLRLDKEVDGIVEVRDESDRQGLRIVIEMKKEANHETIINFLMKKTDLTAKYNYNMVAISNKKPVLMGLLEMLDYYIAHQYEVITRRTKFDLVKAQDRIHILEGLIKAVSVIDEVIKTIRNSSDRSSSKANLISKFKFSEKQAEAIITLQLYRLSSTDITALKQESASLRQLVKELNLVLEDQSTLKKVVINELGLISKTYKQPRLSKIEAEMIDFVVEKKPIIKEDVYVAVTRDGYFKRASIKSYQASEGALPGFKSGDLIIGHGSANTADIILAFTNQGNYLYVPVFELYDGKWKDEGKHISNIINLDGSEKIIKTLLISDFRTDITLVLASKNGLIKRTKLSEFVAQRYSRPINCMNLGKDDQLVGVDYDDGDSSIVLLTSKGLGVSYHASLVSEIGLKAGGVKAIKLDNDNFVIGMTTLKHNQSPGLVLITDRGGLKIFDSSLTSVGSRTNKPTEVFKYFKSVPHHAVSLLLAPEDDNLQLINANAQSRLESIEGNNITTIGRTMQAYFKMEKDEIIIAASNMLLPQITAKTKVFTSSTNASQSEPITEEKNEVASEEDKTKSKNKTIFDYLEDL